MQPNFKRRLPSFANHFLNYSWYALQSIFNTIFYYIYKWLYDLCTKLHVKFGQKTTLTLTGHKMIFTNSKWTNSSSIIKFIELAFRWLFIHLLTRPNDTPNSLYNFSAQIRTFWLVWRFWPLYKPNHENLTKRKLFGTS